MASTLVRLEPSPIGQNLYLLTPIDLSAHPEHPWIPPEKPDQPPVKPPDPPVIITPPPDWTPPPGVEIPPPGTVVPIGGPHPVNPIVMPDFVIINFPGFGPVAVGKPLPPEPEPKK